MPIVLFILFFGTVFFFISLGSAAVNIRSTTNEIRSDIAKVGDAIVRFQQSYSDAERASAQQCLDFPNTPRNEIAAPRNPNSIQQQDSQNRPIVGAAASAAPGPKTRADAYEALSKNPCYTQNLALNLNFGNLTFTQSKRDIRQINTEMTSKIIGLCENNDFVTRLAASYIARQCIASRSYISEVVRCAQNDVDSVECGLFTPRGNSNEKAVSAFVLLSMFEQVSSIFTFYFVPFLIGALGAGAYVLRLTLWQLDNETFDRNSPLFSRYVTRIGLGGLTGLIAGVYFESVSDQSQAFPLPLIISAFLMGYSVEMAFGIFDYWIQIVRRSFNPNKTESDTGTS